MKFNPQRPVFEPKGHRTTVSISGTTVPFLPIPTPAASWPSANSAAKISPPKSETAGPGAYDPNLPPTPQHGHSPSTSSVNGKNSMQQNPPPVDGGLTIVNGNTHGDHSRKPSVTISAAGASGYMPNGGPMSGPSGRPNNLQFGFGSMDTQGSSSNANPEAAPTQQNLGVASSVNARITSPDASPSPIPQPMVSGGRPPSSLQGQGNNLNFGPPSGDQNDMNRSGRPVPQGPNPQANHGRRESTHSTHSDMGAHTLPAGPARGGYGAQGGRGRGGYGHGPPHQGQMGYNHSGPPYRSASNHRGGPNMGHQYGQRQSFGAYPNASGRSPAMANANPATPPVNTVPMANPQVQPQHYPGYPQPMGPQQGFMAPNYYDYYHSQYQVPQFVPPGSPRPPYAPPPNQAPYMQPQYSNQGHPGSQAVPLSRSPSHSTSDRPGSSLGQNQPPPAPPTQAQHAHHPSLPTHHSPTPSQFSAPKKSSGVTIRRPNGDIVTFNRQPSGSPARASPSPVKSNATPTSTPPPRAASRDGSSDQQSDSKPQSGEERKQDFQNAVARAAEEAKKEAEQKKPDDEKPQGEKEEPKKEPSVEKETAPTESEKEAPKEAEAPAAKEAPKPEAPKQPVEDEVDLDALEREFAEKEAAEEAAERAYQEKKQKEKEEQKRKEKEEADAYEANLKNAEREAEAREEEKLKKLAARDDDSKTDQPDTSSSLGRKDAPTPTSTESPAIRTPAESGAATPVSDSSMGPPQKPASAAKRDNKPASLKLETAKATEPPQPSPAMKSLQTARFLQDLSKISYPSSVSSPNPALNAEAKDCKFKYNTEFLLQFQNVFKEKPSLDWDARLKETVGDSSTDSARPSPRVHSVGQRGSNTRPGMPGGFPGGPQMGAFAQSHGKPPMGQGSQDRFPVIGRGMNIGGGNAFGQFPRGSGMGQGGSRTPSGSVQTPGSPRVGSHRGNTRTGSRRDKPSKKEEDANKQMPATQGMAIDPLPVSSSGWKPRSVGKGNLSGPAPGGEGHLPPDVVQGKVKSNLNKMTPEKFDKIADQILAIVAQSKDESDGRTLRQVIQLTFEKATDEAHWAPMYAKFCMRMLESMSPDIKDENIKDRQGNVVTGGSLFRKYLLNRCQEEFERGWKVNLPEKPEGETEEAAMMSDEYYTAAAAKRRGLGLVRFIGELFKLGMLTERIMHECVKKLVDYDDVPDEAEVESLCSLLRTIGFALDSSEKGHSMMDAYFSRINMILQSPNLSSRHKFMLMDVIDLRKTNWQTKESEKGPKTIHEIRETAARAAQEQEMERMRQQANRGGGGRPAMGRGDARNFSGGYGNQPPPPDYASSKVGTDDLRRLKNARTGNQPPSFGPPSMFGSRSSSRRNLGPGGNLVRGGDDSGASSRTGTPPGGKEKKDEKEAASSTNAFSALAGLEAPDTLATSPPSNPSSPPTTKTRPAVEQPKSTLGKDENNAGAS